MSIRKHLRAALAELLWDMSGEAADRTHLEFSAESIQLAHLRTVCEALLRAHADGDEAGKAQWLAVLRDRLDHPTRPSSHGP